MFLAVLVSATLTGTTGIDQAAAAPEPGPIVTVAGTGISGQADNELSGSRAITFDNAGNLYIADRDNHRVQRVTFDTNGNPNTPTTIVGTVGVSGSGPNELFYPAGVTTADDGTLYIADSYNQRIQRVTLDTNGTPTGVTTVLGGNGRGNAANQFNNPFSVVFDNNGALHIVDTFNDRIRRVTFDTNGNPDTNVIIAQDNGTDLLKLPHNIAFDDDNLIYIADTSNDRIQQLTLDPADNTANVLSVIVGFNGSGADLDQLDDPSGIAFDARGRLYVSDRRNNRVQRLTFDRINPTIAAESSSTRVGMTTTINFSCDDLGGAGIDTCAATIGGDAVNSGDTVNSGDPVNTASRGSQTLTITAVDNHGNSTTTTITLIVYGMHELTGGYTQASGPTGLIARLYMAAFTRNPEREGFDFWEASYNNDMPLQAIADHFVAGPEFARLYGQTSNSDFVELMYLNTMERSPDAEGHAFWLEQLDGGMSQSAMLLLFSESPEFKALTYSS